MGIRTLLPGMAINGLKVDPLSEIRNSGIMTNGSVLWTKQVADADYTNFADQVGADVIRNTVADSLLQTRGDRNDYVMVVPADANAVYGVGTAVDITADRVHMVGVGYGEAKRSYSVTIRSNMGTTPDTELVNVTGDGVQIAGIRFLGTLGTNAGGTMSNGVARIAGHDFWAKSCIFEDSTDIWGTPPVVRGMGTAAHDARFDDCFFAITGTGNVESAGNSPLVVGGDGNKRWEFNRSRFTMPMGSTTETFFSPGTGAKERTEFNDCYFGNVNGTTFALTSAIRGSTTANNPVLLNRCSGLAITAMGTDPNVFVTPNESGTAGAGLHNPFIFRVGTAAGPVA